MGTAMLSSRVGRVLPRSPAPVVLGVSLLLTALLFTSCFRPPTPSTNSTPIKATSSPAASVQPTTILWSFWGDPWELEINDRLIKVFQADHPEITVKTLHTSWTDYFQKSEDWLKSDSVPDVMFYDYVPVYASRGLLEDLGPYVDRDKYDVADFYAGLLKYHSYKGRLYGMARDNDTKVIFYNKKLFDEAGLKYPTSDWTWDDLRQMAIKLTRKSGNEINQYGFAYEPDEWWRLWVWQNGGNVYDDDSAPSKTLIDSPKAIEAIQWLADLTNVDRVTPPYDVQKTSLGIGQLFQDGKLAMAFGNHALIPAFASTPTLKWDVVGLPRKVNRVNVAGGSGYVIPARARNKEAAWTFLKWLESPKGQAIFTESGVVVPARRSVGRADIFLKQEPPHNAAVFLDETELGRPNPMFKGVQEASSRFDESFRPVWTGAMNARDAVKKVGPIVDSVIKGQ